MRIVLLVLMVLLAGCSARTGGSAFEHRSCVMGDEGSAVQVYAEGGPFDDAVAWWNIPSEDAARTAVLVRPGTAASGEIVWGPWFEMTRTPATRDVAAPGPWKVDVDTLVGPADAYELVVRGPEARVARRATAGLVASRRSAAAYPEPSRGTPVDIDVPFRSQKTDDPALAGRLCSPASVAMVMAFDGFEVTVADVAARAFDPGAGIYGNWPRNLQAAHELSGGALRAEFVRFADFARLRESLERGTPVIISVKGSLRGAPYSPTEGHLLVVRGMTANGDVVVNDPAFSEARDGVRTYRWDDLVEAWLVNRRGSAYVIRGGER